MSRPNWCHSSEGFLWLNILRHYATKNQSTASQESFIMQITRVSHELTVYVMGDMGHETWLLAWDRACGEQRQPRLMPGNRKQQQSDKNQMQHDKRFKHQCLTLYLKYHKQRQNLGYLGFMTVRLNDPHLLLHWSWGCFKPWPITTSQLPTVCLKNRWS